MKGGMADNERVTLTKERETTRVSWPIVWAAAAAVAVVGLLREVGVPPYDSVWVEDGPVFLPGAWQDAHLFTPWNAYFHVVPRLLAEVVVVWPVEWWAAVTAVIGSAVVAALAVFVFYQSENRIPSPWLRGVLAAWMIVNPITPDMTANLTNLHWVFMVAVFWVFYGKPSRVGPLIVGLGALSNPATAVVCMVGIPAVWGDKRRVGYAIGGIGLSAVHLLAGGGGTDPTVSWETLTTGWALFSQAANGAVFGFTVSALVALVVVWVVFRQGLYGWGILAAAGFFTVGSAVLRNIDDTLRSGRYRYVPAVLLLGGLFTAVSKYPEVVRPAALAVVCVVVLNLPVASRVGPPGWSEAVAAAECVDGVAVVPSHPNGGWYAKVPC